MVYDFSSVYDRRIDGSRKWACVDTEIEFENEKIIPMTVADLEFFASPTINVGLSEYVGNSILGYSSPTVEYFEILKNYMYENYGYKFEEASVVTTPGIVPALATSVRAYSEEGDGVIVFPPVYGPFYDVIEKQNREIIRCELEINDLRHEINFEELEKLAALENTKMILLCSPHNPGGRVWTETELVKIAVIAEKYNLIVVSDEIHADLAFPDTKHTIYGTINEQARNHSVICTSASKMYNIAGLQCSNIIIPNVDLLEKFVEANAAAGLQDANVLGLKATEFAYTSCGEWRQEILDVLLKNRDYAVDYLTKLDERFKVMVPDASFLIWLNVEEFGVDNQTFIGKLIEDCQVYATDGLIYGEEGDYWIRLNIGMPMQELVETLGRLKNLSYLQK